MLITPFRNDVSHPGKRLNHRHGDKGIEEGCQPNGTFFIFTSVTIRLAPSNGINVYSRRRVRINRKRFHLVLCT